MTQEELNFIKDAFSQIIDDIAGNPDWHDAASAVASNLGTLERQLKEKVVELPSNLYEAAHNYDVNNNACEEFDGELEKAFKAGAKLIAGQFQKIEGELVDWYSTSDGKDYCCGIKTIDAFEVPEGFYIRKKQ